MSRAEKMLADLKHAGLKLTPQRVAIVRELADDVMHPTAQSLFLRLRPTYPAMSFATVYNTLDALTRSGLIGALNLGGAVRFDPNTERHDHAVCDTCEAVVDVPRSGGETLTSLALPGVVGFRVLREQRTYRGLCGRCQPSSSSQLVVARKFSS